MTSGFSYVSIQNAPRVSKGSALPRTRDGWGLFRTGQTGWITNETLLRFKQSVRWQAEQPESTTGCIGSRMTVTDMRTGVEHDTIYAPEDIGPMREFSNTSDALLVVLTEEGEPRTTVARIADICQKAPWPRSVDVVCAETSSDVGSEDRTETCITNLVRRYVSDVQFAPIIFVSVGEACLSLVRILHACAQCLDKTTYTFICIHGSFWSGIGPVSREVHELCSFEELEHHRLFFIAAENSSLSGVYPGLPFLPSGCYHAVVRSIPARIFISKEELDLVRCALTS